MNTIVRSEWISSPSIAFVRRFNDVDGQKSQLMITWTTGTGWERGACEVALCGLVLSLRETAKDANVCGVASSDLLEVDECGDLGGARWCLGTGGRRGMRSCW